MGKVHMLCLGNQGTSVGKRTGRHPSRALSGTFVHEVRIPGLYPDGDCLYLRVDGSGSKRWILRTVVQGKRRDMGGRQACCANQLEQARNTDLSRRAQHRQMDWCKPLDGAKATVPFATV